MARTRRSTNLFAGFVWFGVFLNVWSNLGVCGTASWGGTWEAHWPGGDARLELVQHDDSVIGSIPLYGGRLRAHVNGPILEGAWAEGSSHGLFSFRLSQDGSSFFGRFDDGAWWSGERTGRTPVLPPSDQTTPRAVLRSFLLAGDRARAGVPDAIGRAAMLMEFTGATNGLSIQQQVALAQNLFDVVDLTTVDLWSVPEFVYDDHLDVGLRQAGTNVTVPLHLHRLRAGLWWLIAPSPSDIEALRVALVARVGGHALPREADATLPTPRDTMRSFLEGLSKWDGIGRRRVLDSLDLSQLPEAARESQGELVALYLARVMERVGPVITQVIPDDPGSRDVFVHFIHPAGRIAIAPVVDRDKVRWRFTSDTVEHAAGLYAALEAFPPAPGASLTIPETPFFRLRAFVVANAPVLLLGVGFKGVVAWQLLACVATVLAATLLALTVLLIVRLIWRAVGTRLTLQPHSGRGWPLIPLTMAVVWKMVTPLFGLPQAFAATTEIVCDVLLAVGVAACGWQIMDFGSRVLASSHRQTKHGDGIMIPMLIGATRAGLATFATIYIADAFSIPYASIAAGLGIGGVALALASKDTLSNVFGAAILVIDRPFRRGDLIVAGETRGVVEHVGIRSTRIRTAEDSLIIVPNGKLSDTTINNLGSRRRRLAEATLFLPFSSPPEQVDGFIDAVIGQLAINPNIVTDLTQVGVSKLTEHGIEVDLRFYLNVASSEEERQLRQAIMLDIIRLSDRLSVQLGVGHELWRAHYEFKRA